MPGCPELAPPGSSYCPTHQAEQDKAYDQARGSPAARGYGARWRRLRAWHLGRNPICVDPYGLHDTQVPAKHVDHIIPKEQGGTDHEDNLRSLCTTCHSRRHALEGDRWGPTTTR